MLISVSMVVAPWRRFTQVARWNGHAPHTTTGEASANASHIHSSNCSAGIIDSAITGMASAAVISSRCRACSTGSVWSWWPPSWVTWWRGSSSPAGAGRCAS